MHTGYALCMNTTQLLAKTNTDALITALDILNHADALTVEQILVRAWTCDELRTRVAGLAVALDEWDDEVETYFEAIVRLADELL